MIVCGTDGMHPEVSVPHRELREQGSLIGPEGTNGRNGSRVCANAIEIIRGGFLRDRNYERMEGLPMFQKAIDVFVDIRREWVRKDTAKTERAMAEFAPSLKPANETAVDQFVTRNFDERVNAGEKAERQLAVVEI